MFDKKKYQHDYNKQYRKDNPYKILLQSARHRCRKSNLKFDLDEDYLRSLPIAVCPIMGYKLLPLENGKGYSTVDKPTLDRKDSSKGYVRGNVHFISWKANACKSNLTIDQVKSLLSYMERKTETEVSVS